MPSAKRKDFGFVTFDTHDAAVSCAKSINNSEIGEGDSKASILYWLLLGTLCIGLFIGYCNYYWLLMLLVVC